MAAVMIGVDPHKGSHTAVVIDQAEMALDQVKIRACAAQAERLLVWASPWPERTWAVEGAGGPRQCVYWLYRPWQLDGVWQGILTALQARATWPFASSETRA